MLPTRGLWPFPVIQNALPWRWHRLSTPGPDSSHFGVRTAQSQCQALLQATVLWIGRSSGDPWLHVSNNVNEYSSVLRSLAGEGFLAPLSLYGPPS